METEVWSKLGNYFKLIADGEQKLDVSRRVLTEGSNFDPQLCFALLDTNNNSRISGVDLFNFLYQYSLFTF